MWSSRRAATTFSIIFEMKERLETAAETGHSFLRISGSALGFLRSGLTMADLSSEGNFPLVNELFTRSVIVVTSEERMSRSRLVGIGL